MIYSMTGFGRGEYQDAGCRITVEIKSVNHRYLDMSIRLPKRLNPYEGRIRSIIKDYVKRGKIDIFIIYEDLLGKDTGVCYNREVAASYAAFAKEMAEDLGLEDDVSGVSRFLSLPGVFTLEDRSTEDPALQEALDKVMREALESFCRARSVEGEALGRDLLIKLSQMREHVAAIEKRCPEILRDYSEKLHAKVADLLADTRIEESRLLTEVAIFADKVAVDEEVVRLRAHIDSMEKELEKGGDVGRKLDFIAQEMNREANTTLSKANDLTLSGTAIELKTLIEKIREQVQNLE